MQIELEVCLQQPGKGLRRGVGGTEQRMPESRATAVSPWLRTLFCILAISLWSSRKQTREQTARRKSDQVSDMSRRGRGSSVPALSPRTLGGTVGAATCHSTAWSWSGAQGHRTGAVSPEDRGSQPGPFISHMFPRDCWLISVGHQEWSQAGGPVTHRERLTERSPLILAAQPTGSAWSSGRGFPGALLRN